MDPYYRDSLDPRHEGLRSNSEEAGLNSLMKPDQTENKVPSAPPASEVLGKDLFDVSGNELDSGEEEELEEEAARYHENDARRVVGVAQQTNALKPVEDKPLKSEVHRLQNAFTSLAVQVQQLQSKQTFPKPPDESSQWVPRLPASHRLA